MEDISRIIGHLEDIQQSVYDYIEVLRMGIQKGMVRTRGECVAGLNAFKAHHLNISRNGPDGKNYHFSTRDVVTQIFYVQFPFYFEIYTPPKQEYCILRGFLAKCIA